MCVVTGVTSTTLDGYGIAVVREGVVAEEGTHAELLARPEGAYRALVDLQARPDDYD